MTFRQCTEDYLAVNASQWRNAKHRKEWHATLIRYAFPVFGHLSVAAIDSGLVFKALAPLVADKPVTAAAARAHRDRARLRQGRRAPRRRQPRRQGNYRPFAAAALGEGDVNHQPALPFAKLPAFMAELRKMQGLPARLLELIILTGMRLDAVRPARCDEFDLPRASVGDPASRMKNLGRDQRVPLVGRALAIARELTGGRDPEAPVFGHDRPINPNAIRKSVLPKLLKAIGHEPRR